MIELDGPSHDIESNGDARRDRYLGEHGLTVLRFTNHAVWHNRKEVILAIQEAVIERSGR